MSSGWKEYKIRKGGFVSAEGENWWEKWVDECAVVEAAG